MVEAALRMRGGIHCVLDTTLFKAVTKGASTG
jgi:hypothetical protein